MKLIVAIVQDADANKLQQSLNEHDFRSTKLASTGGFLREGNTTFIIGAKDEDVLKIKDLIQANCKERTKLMPTSQYLGGLEGMYVAPMEVVVGGAIVFVVPLDELVRL